MAHRCPRGRCRGGRRARVADRGRRRPDRQALVDHARSSGRAQPQRRPPRDEACFREGPPSRGRGGAQQVQRATHVKGLSRSTATAGQGGKQPQLGGASRRGYPIELVANASCRPPTRHVPPRVRGQGRRLARVGIKIVGPLERTPRPRPARRPGRRRRRRVAPRTSPAARSAVVDSGSRQARRRLPYDQRCSSDRACAGGVERVIGAARVSWRTRKMSRSTQVAGFSGLQPGRPDVEGIRRARSPASCALSACRHRLR